MHKNSTWPGVPVPETVCYMQLLNCWARARPKYTRRSATLKYHQPCAADVTETVEKLSVYEASLLRGQSFSSNYDIAIYIRIFGKYIITHAYQYLEV